MSLRENLFQLVIRMDLLMDESTQQADIKLPVCFVLDASLALVGLNA
jgi:hypothetical protein